MPGSCGLGAERPCTQTPLKKVLCHTRLVGGTALTLSYSSWGGVTLRLAVFAGATQAWPSVSRRLEFLYGFRGPSPQAFTRCGGGLLPGAPNKGNADGAVGIFGHAGCVWAPTLHLDPPQKKPCATLPCSLSRAVTNTASALITLRVPSCWVALRPAVLLTHGSGRVCLGSWRFPPASRGRPPRLLPPSGG